MRLGAQVGDESHDWWGVNRRKWTLLVDQIIPEHADLAPHVDALRDLRDHRAMAATEWIVTMREGLKLLEHYPRDMLHVPYEALCDAPVAMCKRIAAFAGLDEDQVFLNYAETVLKPSSTRVEFALPASIEAPFRQTVDALAPRETM